MARELWGKVERLYVNLPHTKITDVREELRINLTGIVDDKHNVVVRDAKGIQDEQMYGLPRRKGIRIKTAPWRQVTVVAQEEMEELIRRLGIVGNAPQLAQLIGANILVSGFDRFTRIPPAAALHFFDDSLEMPACVMKVECENLPCVVAGQRVKDVYEQVTPEQFVKAALGIRGLVATVLWAGDSEEATIKPGMKMKVWQRGNLADGNIEKTPAARAAVVEELFSLNEMDERTTDRKFLTDMSMILIALLDRYDLSTLRTIIRMLKAKQDLVKATDDEIDYKLFKYLVEKMLPIAVDELPQDVQDYLSDRVLGLKGLTIRATPDALNNQWREARLEALGLLVNIPDGGLEQIIQTYNQTICK